jgi:hypothetical protein
VKPLIKLIATHTEDSGAKFGSGSKMIPKKVSGSAPKPKTQKMAE